MDTLDIVMVLTRELADVAMKLSFAFLAIELGRCLL